MSTTSAARAYEHRTSLRFLPQRLVDEPIRGLNDERFLFSLQLVLWLFLRFCCMGIISSSPRSGPIPCGAPRDSRRLSRSRGCTSGRARNRRCPPRQRHVGEAWVTGGTFGGRLSSIHKYSSFFFSSRRPAQQRNAGRTIERSSSRTRYLIKNPLASELVCEPRGSYSQ